MPVRVGRHKLYFTVLLSAVNIYTCPAVSVDNTASAYYGNRCTRHHLAPTGYIHTRIAVAVFGTGVQGRFDLEGGVGFGDMPHLLAGPHRTIGVRTHAYVSAGVGTQEHTRRTEHHV